jgi:hypothetical protein
MAHHTTRALITKEDEEAHWKIILTAVPTVVQSPVERAG